MAYIEAYARLFDKYLRFSPVLRKRRELFPSIIFTSLFLE
jgi:hypothetical protein